MGLRISTNMASLAAGRTLQRSSESQSKSYQRLSSGQRIINAGDDAAGLTISENLRAQVRSMNQAERNASDGISFVQVAEGGITEIGNMLIRMRELAVQAASDTIGDKERQFINNEVQSMVGEIDRIAKSTAFNGINLLSGESNKSELQFQVGIRKEDNDSDRIVFTPRDYTVTSEALGVDGMDFTSIDGAREALDIVDSGISKAFEARAQLGSAQNKLQSTVNNLQITRENLVAARSRIADTDVALETSELIRGNILQQAGISVLSQANTSPMAAQKLL
jgi:flagellin